MVDRVFQAPIALDAANASCGADCFAVTPSDTVNFDYQARALYIGTQGDVTIVTPRGSVVQWVGLLAGSIIPCACIRVNDTGTDADDIVGII